MICVRITKFIPLGLGGDAIETLYIFFTNRLLNVGPDLYISSFAFKGLENVCKGGLLL